MKLRSSLPGSLLPVFSLSLLLAAGCSDDSPATDAGAPSDVGTPADSGTPSDVGIPVDSGAPDSGVPAAPRVLAVSATGHDRFYGVTFDPTGRFYAAGVVSEGNVAATADFETVVARFTATGELDTTFGQGGYARRNVAGGPRRRGGARASWCSLAGRSSWWPASSTSPPGPTRATATSPWCATTPTGRATPASASTAW
jgi:hypothetical protein